MTRASAGLAAGFFRSAENHPDRPALEISGVPKTYGDLRSSVLSLAQTLVDLAPSNDPPITAVFAHRSATAYAGVLAALARGHGYLPLTPTVPVARNRAVLERVGCGAMIVDSTAESQLGEMLTSLARPMTIVLADKEDVAEYRGRSPRHRFVGSRDLSSSEGFRPLTPDPNDIAYVLFTSGSTGTPKGVMVSHANIAHFLATVADWYSIGPDDRLTQMFELVFDLSLFDLFAAWSHGACICCPSPSDLLLPARYLQSSRATIWFSVPSTAWLMQQQRSLTPDAFPHLRLSLFCGEALPAAVVRAWSAAAPNSAIENLYGPTELTVSCTRYRWRGDESDDECENGVVPIGDPFPEMQALVVDEQLLEVGPGEEGELIMAGPQVTLGYFQSPEQTSAAFVHPPGRTEVFYRTGDRVRRPRPGEPLRYIGRMDHQIKIRGNRVELGEVEAALREATGVQGVVAVGWPRTPGGASGIVAFVHACELDVRAVRARLKARLPRHMIPSDIELVETLPLTTSGKVDRAQLIRRFAERSTRDTRGVASVPNAHSEETT